MVAVIWDAFTFVVLAWGIFMAFVSVWIDW